MVWMSSDFVWHIYVHKRAAIAINLFLTWNLSKVSICAESWLSCTDCRWEQTFNSTWALWSCVFAWAIILGKSKPSTQVPNFGIGSLTICTRTRLLVTAIMIILTMWKTINNTIFSYMIAWTSCHVLTKWQRACPAPTVICHWAQHPT